MKIKINEHETYEFSLPVAQELSVQEFRELVSRFVTVSRLLVKDPMQELVSPSASPQQKRTYKKLQSLSWVTEKKDITPQIFTLHKQGKTVPAEQRLKQMNELLSKNGIDYSIKTYASVYNIFITYEKSVGKLSR